MHWEHRVLAIEPSRKSQEGLVLFRVGMGFPGGTVVKNPPANARDKRDIVLIPGSGRSPGVGNGNPLQYSCLENSMHRGAWWATVHRVTKSRTWLSIAQHQVLQLVEVKSAEAWAGRPLHLREHQRTFG